MAGCDQRDGNYAANKTICARLKDAHFFSR
jgi:hypothetical protein